MTLARDDPGSRLRTTVTRVHAICLFVITIAATTGSTLGWKGRGPLNVLASQPFGYVGLFQAYFLMFLLALVCLIGATRWPSRLWNAALLVAHLAPLSTIVIANGVFVSTNSQRLAYTVATARAHSADTPRNVRTALEGALFPARSHHRVV